MIEKIEHMGVPYFFGDMTDDEMFAHVSAKHARAIISTSPDLEANVVFLENLLEVRKKSKGQFKIILRARTDHDASILYEIGADYVLLPHSAAGRHFAKVIASDPFLQSLHGMKEGDIKRLRDIL
jgi:Trk K+ transport system NAD-binding subunit